MRQRGRIKSSNNSNLLPTITLTPFIDTVLVLLVIFMVTAPGKVVLPDKKEGTHRARDARDYNVVYMTVSNRGILTLNGAPIPLNQCTAHIKHALEKSPVRTVVMKEDPHAPSSVMHAVVDAVRQIDGARMVMI